MVDAAAEDDDTTFVSVQSLFEATVETVCPFGDVVLVVKDDFLPTAKFRVSSCILAMASTHFERLFNGQFAEGERMRSRAPGEVIEIGLFNSPLAMKHLLKLLHHTDPRDDAETLLTTSEMLDLAITVDKYDCIEALRLPIDALLAKYVGNEDLNLEHLTTAAFMVDQPEHFRYFTKQLIATEIMVQSKHFDDRCLELLPQALPPSLMHQQMIALQEVTAQVTQFVKRFTETCKARDRSTLVFTLLDELAQRGLWPLVLEACSIQSFCEKIEAIIIPSLSAGDDIETWPDTRMWRKRSHSTSEMEFGNPQLVRDGWVSGTWRMRRRKQSRGWDPAWKHALEDINTHGQNRLKHMVDSVQQLVVGVCLDCIQKKECRKRHRYHWTDTEPQANTYRIYEDSDGDSVYSRREGKKGQYDVFQRNRQPGERDKAPQPRYSTANVSAG